MLLAAYPGFRWRAPGALQGPITGSYYRGQEMGRPATWSIPRYKP
jgi:hypothetical protein